MKLIIAVKVALLIFVLAALILFGLRLRGRYFSPDLVVTFLDVGQGDAALVEFPYGTTMLVDAGGGHGEWNVGKHELFPELARRGILDLDIALLSHPDQDHGYGFLGLFPEISIKEFWFNHWFLKDARRKPLFTQLRKAALEHNARMRSGEVVVNKEFGGALLRILPIGNRKSATNDRSLVAEVAFAGCRFLFTGDLEEEGEGELSDRVEPVTFLKVAHHGSKTSSTNGFLRSVRPRYGVISAGLRNQYGHPSPEALARLAAYEVQVLRTDFHGFVSFRVTPSGEYFCETGHGSCGRGDCRTSRRP